MPVPMQDPQRAPRSLRKFAKAQPAPVNRVLHPPFTRAW